MHSANIFILLFLCAYAALGDLLTRTIPDLVCLAVAGLGVVLRLRVGLTPAAESIAGAAVLFGLLFLAYTRHAIGGGDVKLASALAVGMPPLLIVDFVVATVLVGGGIGLLYSLLRRCIVRPAGRRRSLLVRIAVIECWRARRHNSVPYGVAIASGAAIVLLPTLTRGFAALHA